MKRETTGAPAGLAELRERIERCRRERPRGAWLPAELREEAGRWAEKLGPSRTARALGLSHGEVRRWGGAVAAEEEPTIDFVELAGAAVGVEAGSVIEMTDGNARLSIRLVAGHTLDVAAVVAAFRGARR